jgi:hypothetical protein
MMRVTKAFLATAVLLAIAGGACAALKGKEPLMVLVVGSAIGVAIDSAVLGLHKYKGGINSPIAAFVGVFIFWPVFFPLYLITRSRMKAGELPLKKQYQIPAVEAAE